MGRKRSDLVLEGEEVVFASEGVKEERRFISEGKGSVEVLMERAAEGIFTVALECIKGEGLTGEVVVLCGKGNNGGDAALVGKKLAGAGFQVTAHKIFDLLDGSGVEFPENGLVIDGIFGTGFRGEVTGIAKDVIEKLNASPNFVLAIDIPSGVCGDSGIVEGVAVDADVTVYIGSLKVGHFYNNGFDHVGKLVRVDIGLFFTLQPFANVVNRGIVPNNLPRRRRTANKYSVGQVLAIAGSPGMAGSAILAATAALKSGAGIVKVFHPLGMECEFSKAPPEIIKRPFSNSEPILEELYRTKAILVGCGLGRGEAIPKMLDELYKIAKCPFVIDGDALFFFQGGVKQVILTPHKGELYHLLKIKKPTSDLKLLELAQEFANQNDLVLVCKGAPTTIVAKNFPKIVVPYGNCGMASAGMGDVLAGIIAAFLAQGKNLREAAILGVTVHALAGDVAKEVKSEYSLVASDLIRALSEVFK